MAIYFFQSGLLLTAKCTGSIGLRSWNHFGWNQGLELFIGVESESIFFFGVEEFVKKKHIRLWLWKPFFLIFKQKFNSWTKNVSRSEVWRFEESESKISELVESEIWELVEFYSKFVGSIGTNSGRLEKMCY